MTAVHMILFQGIYGVFIRKGFLVQWGFNGVDAGHAAGKPPAAQPPSHHPGQGTHFGVKKIPGPDHGDIGSACSPHGGYQIKGPSALPPRIRLTFALSPSMASTTMSRSGLRNLGQAVGINKGSPQIHFTIRVDVQNPGPGQGRFFLPQGGVQGINLRG